MATRKTKQTETRVGENVSTERKQELKEIQAERRSRLTKAANIAGYDTIDKLASAILSGEVVVIKRQPQG